MSEKLDFAISVRREVTALMVAAENLITVLHDTYYDRSYNSDGTDPIVDDDIEDAGITANTVGGVMTAVAQLKNYLHNLSVNIGDHSVNYNKARNL